jgi:hypothetical protein
MKRSIVGLLVTIACLVPAVASAQEDGKVGVTMAFPASVGLIWHASEKIAVRPDFSFAHSSADTSAGETSSNSVGLGVSVLFYTKKWDKAAAYVAPRFQWSHATGESRPDIGDFDSDSSADAYTYTGSAGVQGWIGDRVSVFGEAGLSFTTTTSDSNSPFSSEVKTKSLSLRSGVGVVLYF